MASPWTIPKLVTWRVKDWASCFLACKFPLDDEDRANRDNNNNNDSTRSDNNYTFRKNTKKMMKNKRRERKLSLSPPTTRHFQHLRTTNTRSCSVSPADHRRGSWPPPPLSDDGFIIFCFDRDDSDGFHVVKEDCKPEESSPRTVNRKLTYGDEEVRREKKSPEKETEQDKNNNRSCPGNDEDVSSDVHQKLQEEEEVEETEASGRSSGSNHSDGGRGSFAFPILGEEWMGSPVQMPKSDDLCLKKQKPIVLGFQCCRF